MSTFTEKRRHPRIKLITKVTHMAGKFFHYYYSRDLSLGGIFLETQEPFPIGTEVQLEFPLPEVAERLSVKGKVVRIVERAEDAPGPYPGMGVEFMGMTEEARGMLADFVTRSLTR
jgi:uncharacterized protein (TIGR02266 family)